MSPSVDAVKRLSPDCPVRTVLLPESFRGGCSVGADLGLSPRRSLPHSLMDPLKIAESPPRRKSTLRAAPLRKVKP